MTNTIFIGIDPAEKASGVWVRGISHAMEPGFVCHASEAMDRCRDILCDYSAGRVVVGIESFSRWSRYRDSQKASKAWQAAIRACWPRRNDICPAMPQVWRKAIFGTARLADPKQAAIEYMHRDGYEGEDHNVAEAYCLMVYARRLWEWEQKAKVKA